MATSTRQRKLEPLPRPHWTTAVAWNRMTPLEQRERVRVWSALEDLLNRRVPQHLWPVCSHLAAFDAGGRKPSRAPARSCYPMADADLRRHTPGDAWHGLSHREAHTRMTRGMNTIMKDLST